MSKLNIALVGAGRRGGGAHLPLSRNSKIFTTSSQFAI